MTGVTLLSCNGNSQFTTQSGPNNANTLRSSDSNGPRKPHPGHHPRPTDASNSGNSNSTPAPSPSAAASDLCANLPAPAAQYHCGYDRCDQVERIRIACDLKNAVQDHYSGFFLKNERLSHFDSASHLSDCVKLESTISDNNEVAFTDRMTECVAAFQDTHFRLDTVRPLPAVQAPILVSRIQGHYYVTGLASGLLTGALAQIGYGTEILAVDGETPATAAAHLAPYISSSGDAYRSDQAARALFLRHFAYPTKNTVTVKAKLTSGQTVELPLPWTYLASADRLDTHAIFQKAKITPTTDAAAFNGWQEFSSAIPVMDQIGTADGLAVYVRGALGSDSTPVIRAGMISISGQTTGYLQLLTFNSPTVYGGAKADQALSWTDAVRGFIQSVKAANANLVVDLRWNDGGDPTLADDLQAMLTEPGKTYGAGVVAYRTTDSEGGILWGEGASALPTTMTHYFTTSELAQIFADAYQAKAQETPILVDGDIQADPQIGGYTGKVVALIGDQCISACDRMAALLDRSGRAILIGTPSNGTGLGYADESLFYGWTDWHGLLTVKIPVHLFGVAPAPLGSNTKDHVLPFDANADAYLTENRPTAPKLHFEPTVQDVMLQTHGWVSAITRALPASPSTSTGTPNSVAAKSSP